MWDSQGLTEAAGGVGSRDERADGGGGGRQQRGGRGAASWMGAPGVQEGRNQCGRSHWIEFNLVSLTFWLNSRDRVVGPGMGAGG